MDELTKKATDIVEFIVLHGFTTTSVEYVKGIISAPTEAVETPAPAPATTPAPEAPGDVDGSGIAAQPTPDAPEATPEVSQ